MPYMWAETSGEITMEAPETPTRDKNDQLIAMRIPQTLLDQVVQLAIHNGQTRSGMIRDALNAYTEKHYGPIADDINDLL